MESDYVGINSACGSLIHVRTLMIQTIVEEIFIATRNRTIEIQFGKARVKVIFLSPW